MPIVVKEHSMRQFESILKNALKLPKKIFKEAENLKIIKDSKKLEDIPDFVIPDLDLFKEFKSDDNKLSNSNKIFGRLNLME